MKFCHLILTKIIEFVATRCQLSRLKCTKIDFGWDSAPDPTGGLLLTEEREGREGGEGRRRGRETPSRIGKVKRWQPYSRVTCAVMRRI